MNKILISCDATPKVLLDCTGTKVLIGCDEGTPLTDCVVQPGKLLRFEFAGITSCAPFCVNSANFSSYVEPSDMNHTVFVNPTPVLGNPYGWTVLPGATQGVSPFTAKVTVYEGQDCSGAVLDTYIARLEVSFTFCNAVGGGKSLAIAWDPAPPGGHPIFLEAFSSTINVPDPDYPTCSIEDNWWEAVPNCITADHCGAGEQKGVIAYGGACRVRWVTV